MAKTRARRNGGLIVFHPWSKRWRGPAHRKCSICNPRGRRRGSESRKAVRDAAIQDSAGT